MEREVKIRTRDGKTIYGMLRGNLRRPVIVFVHGLTGHMDEHTYYDGVRFFERHGFSSFRFNLYDWRKGARLLHECTLQTHADDLDRIIEWLRDHSARKVFVIGHSYGGPTILRSRRRNFDAVVLWDPSYGHSLTFTGAKYVKGLKGSIAIWGIGYLIGNAMVREARQMTARKSEGLIRGIHVPIKIIAAGKGELLKGSKRYYAAANPPKAFAIIRGADHNFNYEGNQESLFRETLAWLKCWS